MWILRFHYFYVNRNIFSSFVGIILILVYIFKPGGDLAISKIETAGKIADFPLYFGTVLFALVCVNVILTVESKMKTPKTFVSPFGVLNCALGMSTILYTIFGFLGYLKFRDAIRDTITVNLPASEMYELSLMYMWCSKWLNFHCPTEWWKWHKCCLHSTFLSHSVYKSMLHLRLCGNYGRHILVTTGRESTFSAFYLHWFHVRFNTTVFV